MRMLPCFHKNKKPLYCLYSSNLIHHMSWTPCLNFEESKFVKLKLGLNSTRQMLSASSIKVSNLSSHCTLIFFFIYSNFTIPINFSFFISLSVNKKFSFRSFLLTTFIPPFIILSIFCKNGSASFCIIGLYAS